MWFGTQDGLNRYDGFKFDVYRSVPGDSTSLKDKYIRCLYKSTDGTLWVGSNKGLNRYNYLRDNWEGYEFIDGQDRIVHAIHQFEDGTVWLGTQNGLFTLSPSKGRATYVKSKADNNDYFKTAHITSFLKDKTGKVWVGTGRGLFWWDEQAKQFTQQSIEFDLDPNSQIMLSKDRIKNLYQDSDGVIWVATLGAGMLKIDPVTGSIDVNNHVEEDSKSISYNAVTAILERKPGELWVGTRDMLNVHKKAKDSASV